MVVKLTVFSNVYDLKDSMGYEMNSLFHQSLLLQNLVYIFSESCCQQPEHKKGDCNLMLSQCFWVLQVSIEK